MGAQLLLGIVIPAVFGLITGFMLGASEIGYLLLSVLGILGGYVAGLEHRRVEEGVIRGANGGLLFGVFILVGKEISGAEPKAHLPSPEILLVVITVVAGALLGALGAWTRARRREQTTPIEPAQP